ncbi:MAG: nitroreductase family deazaflavin-dependent oxidoreductase [Chloroflexia bacterium]|nr:nitroreductase family deazaflavin-dependent oxidoreductase [Chloroflexia bacterium]
MYQRPGVIVCKIANPAIRVIISRLGITPQGAHVLSVPRRRSGGMQTVPVNPLDLDGARYLVAPRGTTDWVRNLRAAGEAEMRAGRRRDRFTATEIADDAKQPILRAYLQRWGAMTRSQFGVGADADDAALARIAPDHPVFLLHPRTPG